LQLLCVSFPKKFLFLGVIIIRHILYLVSVLNELKYFHDYYRITLFYHTAQQPFYSNNTNVLGKISIVMDADS
jgi:hypothetical protein